MIYHLYRIIDNIIYYSHTSEKKEIGTSASVTHYCKTVLDANDFLKTNPSNIHWLVCNELIEYEGEDGIITDNRIDNTTRMKFRLMLRIQTPTNYL